MWRFQEKAPANCLSALLLSWWHSPLGKGQNVSMCQPWHCSWECQRKVGPILKSQPTQGPGGAGSTYYPPVVGKMTSIRGTGWTVAVSDTIKDLPGRCLLMRSASSDVCFQKIACYAGIILLWWKVTKWSWAWSFQLSKRSSFKNNRFLTGWSYELFLTSFLTSYCGRSWNGQTVLGTKRPRSACVCWMHASNNKNNIWSWYLA